MQHDVTPSGAGQRADELSGHDGVAASPVNSRRREAIRLPGQRDGGHDRARRGRWEGARSLLELLDEMRDPERARRAGAAPDRVPLTADLPASVEQELAALAGVELPHARNADAHEPDLGGHVDPTASRRRLLRIAQVASIGSTVLVATSAVVSARVGSGGLSVNELALAAWGFAAALSAVTLASLEPADGVRRTHALPRAVLLLALLASVTGVVASAGGTASAAWVLYLPVVVVVAGITGPLVGLSVGALASAGLYTAGVVTGSLTEGDLGRLVVLLPLFPAAGWAAGALSNAARAAAAEADERRAALERDVTELSDLLASVANGDLTTVPALPEGASPESTALAVAFADTLLAMRRVVRQITSVGEQIATSAGEMLHTARDHADGVVAQTSAVQETTSTIEQLAATAATIADTAERVTTYAGSTLRDAREGGAAVDAAVGSMEVIAARVDDLTARARLLTERTRLIHTILETMGELSRRTSMLALNASIEAARAGEHGKGFSLVATEVQRLAERAQEATEQIATIVTEIEAETSATAEASADGAEAVRAGAALAGEVVQSLRRITRMVEQTTAASREITVATRQQRAASDAVVSAMELVTVSSEQYESGSRRYVAAAGELDAVATELRAAIGRFKVS